MKEKIATIKQLLIINSSLLIFASCSFQKQISRSATQLVLKDSSLTTAHVGISIYEPAANKYWFNYQGDHYFVPASNTKIPTCYAAMKYLGDSLVGLRYQNFSDSAINIFPTGDPSFLHDDFKKQPVLDFLKQTNKIIYFSNGSWRDNSLGSGWTWNDYDASYMAERSSFPLHGNIVNYFLKNYYVFGQPTPTSIGLDWQINPSYFKNIISNTFSLPVKELAKKEMADTAARIKKLRSFIVERPFSNNQFSLALGNSIFNRQEIPFYTNRDSTAIEVLKTDYSINIKMGFLSDNSLYGGIPDHLVFHKIHSQPTDSLLKLMMHRSDNFFAEQSLLMVSNELLGYLNDEKIIDTLLKTDFKDLPQKPRWVDGSGLSRYNLFSPQDFVFIFNKMKSDFGMDRIKNILATGNEGTLSDYYKKENGYLFAKTGTLSGVVSISGFLYTQKNKLLIFSVLVNNHNASATAVRRAVEKFIEGIRDKY